MISALFIIFIVCLVLGVPIGVSIGIASLVPSLINPQFPANVDYIIRGMVNGVNNTPILAVPLFVLSGAIMAKGGISRKLFDVFAYFIGDKTAGMPIAVVITCLFYGAISGSGIATTAAVGGMTIPILVSLGYDKVFVAALVAAAGALGIIIPPSIPFVMYGLVTGTSVGAMFTAGIFPGILIGLSLMVYAYIYCVRNGEDKEKIRANHRLLKEKGFFKVFKDSFWAVLSPVIILGGIYTGIVTPTEAAVVSVYYALFVCIFIYKTIRLNNIWSIMVESVRSYAPLLLLLALAMVFGRSLTFLRAPVIIGDFLTSTFSSSFGLLLMINVILLILGMFMDVGPAIIILAPILLPVAVKMGVNPVHFGIITTVNLAVGMVTPPFGVDLFVASPIIDTPVMTVGKKAIPFILFFIIALALITYIPAISLFLLGV